MVSLRLEMPSRKDKHYRFGYLLIAALVGLSSSAIQAQIVPTPNEITTRLNELTQPEKNIPDNQFVLSDELRRVDEEIARYRSAVNVYESANLDLTRIKASATKLFQDIDTLNCEALSAVSPQSLWANLYQIQESTQRLFQRAIDPGARGLLRNDIPNFWKPDLHALSTLANEQVLEPYTFDELPENNKFIVVALLRHIIDVLNSHYIRQEPAKHFNMWQFGINHPILYLSTEALWDELLQLARVPGADGARTDPAARELNDFLENGFKTGEIVSASRLEQCLEHGRAYCEDLTLTTGRRPVLNESDLDRDHMHAFSARMLHASIRKRASAQADVWQRERLEFLFGVWRKGSP